MPRTSTTISLDEPCAERWSKMARVPGGRHCASCQRTVVDFTRMSDAEVVAFLRQTPDTCGRFTEDQLDRPLLGPATPTPRWHNWLAATTAALSLALWQTAPAKAQTVPAPPGSMPRPTLPDAAQSESSTASRPQTTRTDSLVLRGSVRNRWGWPLDGVHVTLHTHESPDRRLLVFTDEHGRYELHLPPDFDLQNATLYFAFRRYHSQQVTLLGSTRHQSVFLRKRRVARYSGPPRFR